MQHYYLLGFPVAHSLSPAMHNTAFKALGIDASYGAVETDEKSLPDTVARLKEEGASGWNVTMPCKGRMFELCDVLSPAAKIARSVNTVKNEDGRLYGYTTDGGGFVKGLSSAGFSVEGKSITILGTGGAASSMIIGCALKGASRIDVFYHSPSSKERIAPMLERLKGVSDAAVGLFPLSDPDALARSVAASALLANATRAGMLTADDPEGLLCAFPESLSFGKCSFVADAIYHPEETVLLKRAKAAGLKVQNGLPMLLFQGAEAFEIWTGREMPAKTVRLEVFGS